MKKRTLLLALSASVIAMGSLSSRGEAAVTASTCTDGCSSEYRYCQRTHEPIDYDYCFEIFEVCRSNCGAA